MSTDDQALQAAQLEASRLHAELAAIEEAGIDPLEIATTRIASELADRRLAEAEVADRERQEQAQAEATDALLDSIWPSLDEESEREWAALQALQVAVDTLADAHRRRSQTASLAIGNVTSAVRPGSTDRYRMDAGVPRVDGRRITSSPVPLSTSVAAITADLIGLGYPQLGQSLRSAGRFGTPLQPPHHQKATA